MNILTEFIEHLSDKERPLSASLFKLKVLAARLNNKEMLEWLNNEINGYINDTDIPAYRHFKSTLMGSYLNGRLKGENQPIYIEGLTENAKHIATNTYFYQGIESLESMISDKTLKLSVPTEMTVIVNNYYQAMGNPYFNLYSLYKNVDGTAPQQIISNVRNISLNLILELEREFGYDINLEELLKNKPKVNDIIDQQIMNLNINMTGDANLINIGNKNEISQKVKIEKNDLEGLKSYLKKNGLDDSDIKKLEDIISVEPKPSIENPTLSDNLQSWIANMVVKAANGTWEIGKQIGVSATANLLSEAILLYYGIK